jgi:hypothetical protein
MRGNDSQKVSERDARRNLRLSIRTWRSNVIDLDTVVDDRRRDVDAAVAALRVTMRERDRAFVHLAHLLELHKEATNAPWRPALEGHQPVMLGSEASA